MTSKILIFLLFALTSCFSWSKNHTSPVELVELNRYLGEWYEIASIPQWFSKGCHCTRAKYGLKKSGKLSVLNTCNKKSIDGKLSNAKGVAKIVDKKSNAKLKVSFFWPFSGAYWIIGLAEDYRYAVVSNEDGSTLWILSRTPKMESSDLDQVMKIIEDNGIDQSKLKFTEQQGCTYPQ